MKIKRLIFILILIVVSIIFTTIFVKIGIKENVSLRDSKIAIKNYSLYSEIILPPGSTSDDLQEAVNNASSGDIIIILDNIAYTTTTQSVSIPEDKEITIQSDTGNNWVLSQSKASVRHFTVNGILTLQNLTLEGGNTGGGIRVNSGATFNMNDNTTVQNCYNYDGGAVITYGIFNMYKANITKCSSGNGGGVRCNAGGEFNIYGGTIADNVSSIGGGVNIAYLR